MPRYFFDIIEGPCSFADEEGLEFETIGAAEDEAIKSLADVARDALRAGLSNIEIIVRDESRSLISMRLKLDIAKATVG